MNEKPFTPTSHEASSTLWAALVSRLQAAGKTTEAREALAKAIAAAPPVAADLLALAKLANGIGDGRAELTLLLRASQLAATAEGGEARVLPLGPALQQRLVRLLAEDGRLEEALQLQRDLLKRKPDHEPWRVREVLLLLGLQRPRDALEIVTDLVKRETPSEAAVLLWAKIVVDHLHRPDLTVKPLVAWTAPETDDHSAGPLAGSAAVRDVRDRIRGMITPRAA